MSNSEEFIRSRETLSPQLPLQDHSHKSISHHHLSLSFVLIDKVFLCIHTLCLPTGCTWFFCTKWNRLPEASAQIWNRKLKGYRLWSLQHTVLKEAAMYVHVHYWKPIRGGKQGRNLALERPSRTLGGKNLEEIKQEEDAETAYPFWKWQELHF